LSVELPPWLTAHWSRDPERDRLISEHGLTKVILSDGQLHMWGPPESVAVASAAVAAVIAAGGARIDGGQGFAALFKARNAAHRQPMATKSFAANTAVGRTGVGIMIRPSAASRPAATVSPRVEMASRLASSVASTTASAP
jgi:hypothetical protein